MLKDKVLYKYILIGVITVSIDYSAIFLFYSIIESHYILAIIMGFVFSNIFQFYSNFFYTFKLERSDIFFKRSVLYVISAIIGIVIGTLTVVYFNSFLDSLYLAKTLSLFVSFLYGFTASKYIVFNKSLRF